MCEAQTGEEQAVLLADRGCANQFFTRRQLLDHGFTFQRLTIKAVLAFCAAFDSVDRPVLWHCLLRNELPEKGVGHQRVVPASFTILPW